MNLQAQSNDDALRPLDAITGATYVDDLLGIIGSKFPVGN